MVACPGEVVWPDVGDHVLLVYLEPAPQDVQLGCSSDEALALGGFLYSAVKAEEQEDVGAVDALEREVLGMDVGASEDGAFWLAFLRSLTARGLSGVELVTSDAHQGLKNAIAAVFAGASWQRCRTHFMANLLTRVPKRAQSGVATMVRTIYQQLSPAEVHAQLDRVVEQLREPFPQVADLLADAAPDILAFTAFPVAHWQKLWSNNPQERLNKEIRRRTDVVGIFPNRRSARRLVGAVLAEQHDEWAEGRRYLTIPNAVGNEAMPTPNMLDAAA